MVRTKKTSAAKMNGKPNGTPKSAPTESSAVKSPPQPVELTEEARANLKAWLDKQEKPFTVATDPPSRKRKRNSGMQLQSDLFEDRLSIQYEVRPRDKWEALRRYKKFTVGAESIAIGQCILVKHDEADEAKIDIAGQWKARVCEVRALDTEHVFIRVAWLNRPEDLDTGRKPYHGKNELIPTNQMDVIDAFSVNGSVEVVHWDELDDESVELISEDQYFWRQTYDLSNTKTFSRLRTICIDSAPQNPDEMILQCSNADCRKWLHVKCMAEDAVGQAANEAAGSKKPTPKKPRLKEVSISKDSSAVAKAENDSFSAEVFVRGMPSGANTTPSEKSEVIITSKGSDDKQVQDVACLFCHRVIE